MGRRQGRQVFRGRSAPNALPARSLADRVGFLGDGVFTLTPEVPFDVVGPKKTTKYGELSARRAQMKTKMALKAGVTGYGCIIGTHATITYPLSEKENALLHSMEACAIDGEVVKADEVAEEAIREGAAIA